MEALTRRARIVAEFRRRLGSMRAGEPAEDPYPVGIDFLTAGGSLQEMHETVRLGVAIADTDEQVAPKLQQAVRQLTMVVEFVVVVDAGEEPSQVGNRVLGALQRRLREDVNLTEPDDGRPLSDRQVSEHVVELRNQLFIDGYGDRRVSGATFWQVTYKTSINDPRLLVGARA